MKLLLLITAFTFQVSAAVLGQQVTISVKDAPLKDVMQSIRKQTGYYFFFQSDYLKNAKPVTLNVKQSPIDKVLQTIFKDQPFIYEVDGKMITLRPKQESTVNKVNDFLTVITIRGKVVDEQGKPLVGVTVRVKKGNIGKVTNENGEYEISADENSILVISYVGYLTQEINVKGNRLIDVSLKQSLENLNEINIASTGYQSIPKERVTGSFAIVDRELFNRQVSPDVISRLNGIAPSLLFNQKAGTTKLSIRGQSTIFANDQPLIVIDNFPFEGDINSVNPNDVESVTFLRDAAAASIWGVRAGNGVIVITTKKGRNSMPSFSFNANVTMFEHPDLFYFPRISTSDFIDVERFLFQQGKYDTDIGNTTNNPPLSPVIEILLKERNNQLTHTQAEALLDGLRQNDVRRDLNKYFYRNALNQQYALSVNGGSERCTYYFSGGFDKNLLQSKGSDFQRFTLNFSNIFKPIKNLEIGVNLVQTQTKNEFNNTIDNISMSNAISIYPYAQLADAEGIALPITKNIRTSFANDAVSKGFLDWTYRPLEDLNLSDNHSKVINTRINSNIKYRIMPGLVVEFRYQIEKEDYRSTNNQTLNSYYTRNLINSYSNFDGAVVIRNVPLGDILTTSNSYLTSKNGRSQFNYNRRFKQHEISAIAGYEVREVLSNGYSSRFYGYDVSTGGYKNVDLNTVFTLYPTANTSTIPGPGELTGTVDRFRSYFANFGYTFNDKYTLTGSLRRDESNLFGVQANQKGVPLWSTGVLWNISKERFYSANWPSVKIRASYGYNGNFDNTVTAYTTALYSGNSSVVQQPYAALRTPANSKLRWEKIGIINFGLDFSTLGSGISGSVDYYRKKGTDLIGLGPINPTTGFNTFKGNIAGMKSSGVDVQLNTINLNKPFLWTTNILLSHVTDKVTGYQLIPTTSLLINDASSTIGGGTISPVIGKPVYSIFSYRWAGLSATGDPQGIVDGKASIDYTKLLNVAPDSLEYNGRATPSFFGALRNTIVYRFWSLSFNITYKFGYHFRRQSINYTNLVNHGIGYGDYSERWKNSGDENHTNVPAFTYPNQMTRDQFYTSSSILIEKGDHIRLQDIRLSASLSQRFSRRIGLNTFEFYAYANNIGILWRANDHHLDPDFGSFIPTCRSIALGLKGTF